MKDMIVIAVDPGVTVGMAAVRFFEGPPFHELVGLCQVDTSDWSVRGLPQMIWWLESYHDAARELQKECHVPIYLAVENFLVPAAVRNPTGTRHTLLALGALQFYGTGHELPVVLVQPAETKAIPMDRIVQVSGMSPQELRATPHAADAFRIAVVCSMKKSRG